MKNYRDPEKENFPGQDQPSMIVPDYKLGPDGELVEVGKIDLQEIIDSNLKSTLDAILDKFLGSSMLPQQPPRRMDVDFLQDDLENLSEAKAFFDECRERYNRPFDTDDEILYFIRGQAEKNKNQKGEKNDEKPKENQSQEKPAPVQKDGEPAS